MKFIFIGIMVVLAAIFLGLNFMAIYELKEMLDRLADTYNNFCDEMELLAETLQAYHELLNDYQIPMVANPTERLLQVVNSTDDW